MSKPTKSIRVLVVDDSAFIRHAVSKHLGADPEVEVIGQATDGLDALEQVRKLKPDVVTLDVEMPRLDGLGMLERLMRERPTPVVMLSSVTSEGADATMRALALGAVDFVTKPSLNVTVGRVMAELIAKIKAAAASRVKPKPIPLRPAPPAAREARSLRPLRRNDKVLVIGSSTGGPRALYEVIPALPADLPVAVLVVQHMPAGFTRSLAQRLDQATALVVKEAETGDSLRAHQVLVAPGGYHMLIGENGAVALDDGPTVNGVRPSVDVTMKALAEHYGPRVVAVVLTGMGRDGMAGALAIKARGGRVIAEDESTCVVYGMPKSVVEAGAVDKIVPLPDIARETARMILNDMRRRNGGSRVRVGAAQDARAYGH